MAFEDDEWWCHGVEPGGLTANGDLPAIAFSAFKEAFQGILQDLAQDAGGLEGFKTAVETFAADADTNEGVRWASARDEIRAGTPVDAQFSELERFTDQIVSGASVVSLDRVSAGEELIGLAESPRAA